MPELTVLGQYNVIKPGFYMPNRLSKATGKALHHLLDGKVCYLVDSTFPPAPDIMTYLRGKQVDIEYFDFRHTTSRAVREQILNRLNAGTSVVFLPGIVARTSGALSDVPAPFLSTVGSLHISPVPVFVGHYGGTFGTLFCYDDNPACEREVMKILPHLPSGPQTGERLLGSWLEAGAQIFADQPLLNTSLASQMVYAMKAHLDQEIIDGLTGTKISYARILGVSMSFARLLERRGEKRVGIMMPPGTGGIIAIMSCLLAGVTPVMINYSSSRAAFESTVRQARLNTFISARKFMQKLPGFPWPEKDKLLLIENVLKQLPKPSLIANMVLAKYAPAPSICKMYDADSRSGTAEGVMLFTSGSSGEPKGVVLTHRMILANVSQCASRIPLKDEVFMGNLPVFHSFGLTVTLFLPVLHGFPIVAYPNPTDARTLCELIKKHRVTLLCATPTFARAMLRRAQPDTFSSVRHFIVGAEKLQASLDQEFRERCGVNLLEGYGLTETTPIISLNMPNAPLVPGSAFYVPGQVKGSIGACVPGVAVRITDLADDSVVLPLTERGMIWFKGANVFSGYVGKPELNSEIFRDGWFKSGDIGSMDLNGFITLGGRLSRFSKVGGEMVPHQGLEAAISEYLKLTAADGLKIAVTGISDEQKGEALVLLSALPGHQRSSQESEILSDIRHYLSTHGMPALWAPRHLVPVEAIPVLATGKLDLRSCRLLAEEALQ